MNGCSLFQAAQSGHCITKLHKVKNNFFLPGKVKMSGRRLNRPEQKASELWVFDKFTQVIIDFPVLSLV